MNEQHNYVYFYHLLNQFLKHKIIVHRLILYKLLLDEINVSKEYLKKKKLYVIIFWFSGYLVFMYCFQLKFFMLCNKHIVFGLRFLLTQFLYPLSHCLRQRYFLILMSL